MESPANHGGARDTEQGATLHLDSVKNRAKQSGASVRTQKMADQVAKADPELAKQVGIGEVTLLKAVALVEAKKLKKKKQKPVKANPEPIDWGKARQSWPQKQ